MIKNFKKSNNGFTLIELIVVMIIIGILVLLATPRFVRYIEEARYTRIINDIRVVETVSVPEMVKNNMEFPKGTEEEETDLSTSANEKRAYMKDGLVIDEFDGFKPDVGNISEIKSYDVSHGFYKLDKNNFVRPETKTRLKGDFYINKEGYVVYTDNRSAKGEEDEVSFLKRELFIYESNNPKDEKAGYIVGLNMDNVYFNTELHPENVSNETKLYGQAFIGKNEIERREMEFDGTIYKYPEIPNERRMPGGKSVPIKVIRDAIGEENRKKEDIAFFVDELKFGDNMEEIGRGPKVIRGKEGAFNFFNEVIESNFSGSYSVYFDKFRIKSGIDFNKVEKVGYEAFKHSILDFPLDKKNIKTIGESAFWGAMFTGDFDTKGLEVIEDRAFVYSKFTGSFDSSGIKSIGNLAFTNSEFTGDFDAKGITSIGNNAFENSKFTGDFDAKGITSIGISAFASSKFNGNLEVGDLKTIGDLAFFSSEFTGPFDPKGITSIGASAFKNSKFTGPFDPKGITRIGNSTFENSEFTGDFDAKELISIGARAFKNSKFTGSFEVGKLKEIWENTFENSEFTGPFDPKGITSIGASAFENSKFTGPFDSKGITRIGARAFKNSEFTGPFDPKGITDIGNNAFENSNFNGEFKAGKIKRIHKSAFLKSKFTGGFNPESIVTIESRAFFNSEFTGNLNTGKVIIIGDYALGNSTFDSIKLGEKLSSIGTKAFGNTENTSAGSEEAEDGKLHSMILPNLETLKANSLTGLKIEGTLNIPNIKIMGMDSNSAGNEIGPAGFDSCNFTEIIVPNKIRTEEGKQEFINAVKDNIYWKYKR